MKFVALLFVALVAITLFIQYRKARTARRERFIQDYPFPKGLIAKLQKQYPMLSEDQCSLVGQGLKQFFIAHGRSRKFVSMPSVVVDDLWHEFILYTKAYESFCRNAFGKFMHHTPAVVLGVQQRNRDGLHRMWWHACNQENINPQKPARLPLIFALDAQLAIPNGFIYAPNCAGIKRTDSGSTCYCAADFGCSSSDSGSGGSGSHSGSGADGGGDSGSSSGDGGGGCGGGGCGGGGD